MLYGMVRFEHIQHSDIWTSLEFSLASQSTERRDGTADGAPFAAWPCQGDSRARWQLCGLLSVGVAGLATSCRTSRRMRFHEAAFLLDQGPHRQHLHLPGGCCRPLRMSSVSPPPIKPRLARGLGRQRRPWNDARLCALPCFFSAQRYCLRVPLSSEAAF